MFNTDNEDPFGSTIGWTDACKMHIVLAPFQNFLPGFVQVHIWYFVATKIYENSKTE